MPKDKHEKGGERKDKKPSIEPNPKEKVIPLEGIGLPSMNKDIVQKILDTWPDTVRYFAINAKMTRERYNSLLEENFTKEQALELSKTLF